MASGADKYKLVSPGVQFSEIDRSQLPGTRRGRGPVIVGRAQRGPALRPVTVGSFSEFVEIFGEPHAGGIGGDVWRDGNRLAPTYGAYAAQAWLKNNNNLTFVRLLGAEHQEADSSGGQAGWRVGSGPDTTLSAGGAYGLFVMDSGSTVVGNTGSLAAIFYLSEGVIELSGTTRNGETAITGTAQLIQSIGANKEFKALIKDSTGATTDTITFNFDRTSKKYIRSVFNTNPTLLNTSITNTSQRKKYFLGETFDRSVADKVTSNTAGGQFAMILGMLSGTINQCDQRMSMAAAKSGWFISQDLSSDLLAFNPANMTKLFRLVAHDSGEWEQRNLKISIADLKASNSPQNNPYGTFSVLIRRASDSDNSVEVLERFSQCDLNPNSPNYIARKIGDRFQEWDDTERRFRYFGNFVNNSRYVRVEMNADVDAGATSPELLPFGFLGPVRFKGFTVLSGTQEVKAFGTNLVGGTDFIGAFAQGNLDITKSRAKSTVFANVGDLDFTGSFVFPAIPTRTTTRQGSLSSAKQAYFGIDVGQASSIKFDKSLFDVVRKMPEDLDPSVDSNSSLEYSFVFSLDDVARLGTSDAQWASGSRAAGTSFTGQTGSYDAILTAGFDKFTAPLVGGFDGLDVTEKEPFNNRVLSGQTQLSSYEFNSVKRAIDSVADPEVVECSIISAPGVTNTGITDHIISVCETRADSLGVIDIEGDYVPPSENTSGDNATANRGSVDTTVSNLKARNLNSSYACAYYPWVQIRDTESGAAVWVPPSVAAIGVLSNTEKKADLWMAPAGFTRGGLSNGAAGIPVTNVKSRLTSTERDKLYEVNINPIATFPAEGIVVYGQKTLQFTPSAVDRINVRRLMNHLKVEIAKIASTLVFEQNVQMTWDKFKNTTELFLKSVKSRFGVDEFRVILDKTTTTDDLKDRNAIYAKIYIKPSKAVEHILLDFIITRSGASFDD